MSAVTIRSLSLPDAGQSGLVELTLGDSSDAEQSKQWIMARVSVETPSTRSVLTLQILALKQLHEIAFAEMQRLERKRSDSQQRPE